MWEGEQFEALGTFGYVALFIVAGLAGAPLKRQSRHALTLRSLRSNCGRLCVKHVQRRRRGR
jgi:hypothetical protein